MVRKRLELALTGRAIHDKFVIIGLFHQACIDELGHQASGHLPILALLPEQLQLLLHLLELLQLVLHICGFLLLCELLFTDPLKGAASFATHFEHVGGDALRHYGQDKFSNEKDANGTYSSQGCLLGTWPQWQGPWLS